jgi:hypothetical protein
MSVTNMVAEVILEFGTEEQKARHISRLASGEYAAGAFGLTEPQAGSDPSGMKTMAVRDGDDFILNGSKLFITSAEYAGVFVVWAVTDRDAGRGRGITAFLLEPGFPGFTVGRDEGKMGQRGSSTNELIFTDCRCRPRGCWEGWTTDSASPWRNWTAAASASPRCPWASAWRPWTAPPPTPGNGSSSAGPLPSFRPSNS